MLVYQMRLINTVIIIILFSCLSFAQDASEQLKDAERLLKEEKVEDAVSLYENILSEGYASEHVFYNLGTAYTSLGKPGKAVLYLKKALKSNPLHSEAKHNLQIARNTVDLEIIAIPEFFLLRYWRSFAGIMSSSVWALLGMLCLIAAAIACYYWLFGQSIERKKKAFYGLISGVLLFLLTLAAGWSKYKEETTTKYAVIMESSALFEGPDDRSEALIQLSPGVECVILDQISTYLKVKLRDQEIGWVSAEKLERV